MYLIESLKGRFTIFLIIFCLIGAKTGLSQKVGVVLSGGGATGIAHIGVLKALEEAEIPIDYIVGSSAGALVAALYASGYSPDEIEHYVLSDIFNKLISDKPSKEERFLLRENETDASMLNFYFTFDSLLYKSLPTNFLTPAYLDLELLRMLGVAGMSVNKDFDSLFIPFRCVAADIYNKKTVVFAKGDLNATVRASMTFPFFMNPIRINDQLLFDGGLYNNFPSDVLYEEFSVDYIIGSNVSGNDPPPSEDDIIGQVTTLFTHKSKFDLPCNYGIIIEPETDIGTFEFSKANLAIESGYSATLKLIDSIRQNVAAIQTTKELEEKRTAFKNNFIPFNIDNVEVHSRKKYDVSFVKDNFMKDTLPEPLSFEEFEKRYFRAYTSSQIKYIFPTLERDKDSLLTLHLAVEKQKPFSIRVGGHFSSRPINTAYIGLSYSDIGQGAMAIHGETYFGKFYSSTKINLDYDLPTLFPIRFSPYFVLNQWNYFVNSSTFFENTSPSYLTQNEMYYGLNFSFSNQRNGKYSLDVKKFKNTDKYYQTDKYTESDTADFTLFQGESASFRYERNSLNRKQWASAGSFVRIIARYNQGKENSISGSTSVKEYDIRKWHQWLNISLEGKQYFKLSSFFKLGAFGQFTMNTKSSFSNYKASVLAASEFSPLPDMQTLFMEEYRAPQFFGGGIDIIFNYKKSLELRLSPYYFQPFKQIIQKPKDDFGYSKLLEEGTPLASASLIYHSLFGPIRLSSHYFPKQDQPIMLQISFGYVIFNERAIR